ncbi:transglutaminase-like domain-containing protein [Bacillus sp. 31A1R]|uniref:Transglutaminase-like domain-containing protein n=1 Tax=Robertmurraya mangrovi TaxID=3098077 RepID=A0ABU5J4S5_9BACI|nr:transglutaminase-like domain-containing protein [Bacillus sp. 31A1R]MDZ5474417.1 transglutaminase-like domain-containing protein [Bacillus sp. 31A1R]
MSKKNPILTVWVCLLSTLLFLSACSSDTSNSETKVIKKEEDKFEKLAKEKNKELELEPIELTSYSEEVGATLKEPGYKEFAVNGKVVVEGAIEKYTELKSNFVWIKVQSDEDGPAGNQHEYYAVLKDGKFKQEIRFFNGAGEYQVKVQVPSKDSENYYYDTASFTVHNVNPEKERDVTYSPFGQEAGITLNQDLGYLVDNEVFSISGDAGNLTDQDTIMLKLNKDAESWQHVLPIENGKFSYDVPLFFGKGVHELEILVPDKERENYYQTATKILIENESDRIMKPIEYSRTYRERGVTLESPQFGGVESNGVFGVKGKIDPSVEFGPETTHIYVTTKKGEDEALDVIPVENFNFDGSFYLRFGPGTYEVTLSVPEIKEQNSDYFRYFGFAKFEVEASSEDKRDLLPSRGVESDAPEVISLANELTEGITDERKKAKAIYKYVASNVSYDVDKYENKEFSWDDSALKTLQSKTGVCQDYSYLAVALLRASNIEARMIEGTAFGGFWPSNHAWVEAKVDGEWLTMDPTWGAGYIKDGEFVADYNTKYFDPKKSEFKKTHMRKGVSY